MEKFPKSFINIRSGFVPGSINSNHSVISQYNENYEDCGFRPLRRIICWKNVVKANKLYLLLFSTTESVAEYSKQNSLPYSGLGSMLSICVRVYSIEPCV